MTKWQKFWHDAYLYLWHDFWEKLGNIRRRIWNKRIKLWWYRLWIRKDELHSSLDIDNQALAVMNKEERERYVDDITRRREIARKRALAREDFESLMK